MANLKLKKLSRMPIGTHVEITYSAGDSNRKISGILTDSDFSESVEITAYDGECIVLDFSLILGVLETKSIREVLTNTPIGTKVRFSYGDENQREPNTAGTVTDNDNEESIEISVSTGKEIVLDYDLIRSFLVIDSARTIHSKTKEAAVPVIDSGESTRVEPSRSAKLLEQEPEDNGGIVVCHGIAVGKKHGAFAVGVDSPAGIIEAVAHKHCAIGTDCLGSRQRLGFAIQTHAKGVGARVCSGRCFGCRALCGSRRHGDTGSCFSAGSHAQKHQTGQKQG